MAIPLITSEGLFTRWGVEIGGRNELDANRNGTFGTRVNTIAAKYDSTDQDVIDGLYTQRDNFRLTGQTLATYYAALCQATAIEMANDSAPINPENVNTAIDAIVVYMNSVGSGIVAPTVTAVVTPYASNVGDAVLVASTKDQNGFQLDYAFAETIVATVTSDAGLGSVAKQEPIQYVGQIAAANTDYNWPQGSGTTLTSQETDAGTTTKLSNGDFETWASPTTAMATSWALNSGSTINSTVKRNTSVVLTGSNSCEFAGDGATLIGINQLLSLSPQTVYAVNLFIRLSAVPAAGILQVRLLNGLPGVGTVVNDAQGTANSFTQALTSGVPTATWLAINGFFRTPLTLPSTVYLDVSCSSGNALSNSRSLYIDRVALVAATQLYAGGIFAACFSGGTNSQKGDYWSIAVANNKTTSSFCRALDRELSLRTRGKRIPTGGGISDALIL